MQGTGAGFTLFYILVAAAAAVLIGHLSSGEKTPPYRLPTDIVPHVYNLSISTDLDSFTFNGRVDIEIESKSKTDTIKIHTLKLKIAEKDVTLTDAADKKDVAVSGVKFDEENNFLVIVTGQSLAAGSRYWLHIKFSGEITDGLSGYYRSSYFDKATNTTRWMAVTQFEPTDARRAFPCFDEPVMKAKFRIRMGHKADLKALSNMPIINTYNDQGLVWDEFQETVPMSTYLVAFMVSDLVSLESKPEPNKTWVFRVWARKEAIKQAEFPAKWGPKFLDYYEEFFDEAYPLPKVDNVAIPDFSFGAMENWGLIFYRDSFLVDPETTSVSTMVGNICTVAHELSHQWFGNLVTMKWWSDLWLNEGFATYIASLALRHQFPKWNSFNIDMGGNLLAVFDLDSLKSSHPVSVPITNPSEINEIFDSISYNKGSLLLHMMSSFLGADIFRNGVRKYVKKYKYGNSEQDDLWACLTEAAEEEKVLPSGVTVKKIMDTWTLQTGYPVLTVNREQGSGKLTVSQKRFLQVHPKEGEKVEGCWSVPLTFSTASNLSFTNTQSHHWLQCDQQEYSLDTGAEANDWIILNNQATALYRVNYDTQGWSLIADALNGPNARSIHELNRLQIISDAMSLANVGDLSYGVALRVLNYMKHETAYLPWSSATKSLKDLELILWRTPKYQDFSKLVQQLLGEVYKKFQDLSVVPDNVEESRHKELIVTWACLYQVGDCSSQAVKLFNQWMSSTDGNNPIPKDIRDHIYCEGIKRGGEAEWQFVWQKYLNTNVASEKNSFLSALGCTEREDILKRYLEWSITPTSGIRRQDCKRVYQNVAGTSQLGYKIAKSFLENNILRIHDFLAPNTQDLASYIKAVAYRIVYKEEFEQMKEFVTTHKELLKNSQLKVKQALESAEFNLRWMETFYHTINFQTSTNLF